VPFGLRSGKALGEDRRQILVRFRPVPHRPFADDRGPDMLCLTFDPDSISLGINLNGAGDWFDLEQFGHRSGVGGREVVVVEVDQDVRHNSDDPRPC
jgi:glucose-6-phosphate 1-dehydrogenase